MANPTGAPPPLPSYKNPPVTEVSFGVIFSALQSLQSRHLGQFWSEQKKEYPRTEDLSPLLDMTDVEAQRLVVMPIPPLRRMMCYSPGDEYVAQVQDARLHFNWRKVRPSDQYPRYNEVHRKFEAFWMDFIKFVEREKIGSPSVQRLELSYFNHIELGPDIAASVEEHIKVFKFSPILGGYLSPPESVNAVWRFAMPNQRGTATATLNNGTDKDGKNLLMMVLTCTGTQSEKHSDSDWYEAAHEWIVRSFTDLTTDKAHQKWGKER
jgi:uncharacterized protein (TIGR04255 family)